MHGRVHCRTCPVTLNSVSSNFVAIYEAQQPADCRLDSSTPDEGIERSNLLHCICLLLAQGRHFTVEFQCPLLRVKRTLVSHSAMSAFDPKRTLPERRP